MALLAKLIKGKDYRIMGQTFLAGREVPVSTEVFNALESLPEFELINSEDLINEDHEGDDEVDAPYTRIQLKRLTKAQQEEIILNLEGDPTLVSNEKGRIDYILKLQEQLNEESEDEDEEDLEDQIEDLEEDE